MDLLPLEVYDEPWLVEKKPIVNKLIEILHVRREELDGIWALYFNDKSLMNEIWKLAVKSFREGKLNGVYSIKCSTEYNNFTTMDDCNILTFLSKGAIERTDIFDKFNVIAKERIEKDLKYYQ